MLHFAPVIGEPTGAGGGEDGLAEGFEEFGDFGETGAAGVDVRQKIFDFGDNVRLLRIWSQPKIDKLKILTRDLWLSRSTNRVFKPTISQGVVQKVKVAEMLVKIVERHCVSSDISAGLGDIQGAACCTTAGYENSGVLVVIFRVETDLSVRT